MSDLKSKLDSMIGKTYMYRTETQKVISYEFKDSTGKIIIITNKSTIMFSFSDAKEKLTDFLICEEEKNIDVAIYKPEISSTVMIDVKNILMDNIKKVQDDKEYIPQAIAINKNVKSIIELAKTEIEMINTINKL
jgi:hypothetical protein